MNWFTSLFTDAGSKITDSVMKGIDNLFTSDEEREIIKSQLKQNLQKQLVDLENSVIEQQKEYERQITERWKHDDQSDSKLAKSTRPLIALAWNSGYILAMLGSLMLLDPARLEILNSLLPYISSVVAVINVAYFGSRGMEKITKQKNNQQQQLKNQLQNNQLQNQKLLGS